MSRSARAYLVLAVVILLARLALALWPTPAVYPSQAVALSWPAVLIALLPGCGGLYLAGRVGFPALMAAEVTHRQRFLLPAGSGSARRPSRL